MKSNRRLVLRREVMTALVSDELRAVAPGQGTLQGCIVVQATLVLCNTQLFTCITTLDPPRCAGV